MELMPVQITDQFLQTHPRTSIGFLMVSCKVNLKESPMLQLSKQQIAIDLQTRFPSQNVIKTDAIIQAYQVYYQQYKSNYHVRFQIESVALKGKALPTRSVLVDAMFMAELTHGLLIAGHDMRFIQFPLCVDCTQESEQYPLLSSELKTVKSADMCIRDAAKILSSILYGPEQSSPISLNTTQALYCIYGPDGVRNQKINAALDLIAQYVSLALPEMKVLWKIVVP